MKISAELFQNQKTNSWKIKQEPLSFRKKYLKHLLKVVLQHEAEICEAHKKDFAKPANETLLTEIYPVVKEIRMILKNLNFWAQAEPVASGALLLGTYSEIRQEPKGTVLVIAPWNYPFSLSLVALASAIGAGNTVMLKPSELTPHVSTLLEKILTAVFPAEYVCTIQGGVQTSQELLALPFDHIFFTGSTAVGKIVMAAAAKNLSSVTLELGGKSPAFIHASCDLKLTVTKMLMGKIINGGQTCVSPDYAFVDAKICDQFILEMQKQLQLRYSDPTATAAIISAGHFLRLKTLLLDAYKDGAQVFSSSKKISTAPELQDLLADKELRFPPMMILNPEEKSAVLS